MFSPYKKKLILCYLDNYKGKKISFKTLKEIPERLKHFATIQFHNTVLLCGGMNSKFENPEDVLSDQFDYTHDDGFLFDVKNNVML